jgi:hypothetical protein
MRSQDQHHYSIPPRLMACGTDCVASNGEINLVKTIHAWHIVTGNTNGIQSMYRFWYCKGIWACGSVVGRYNIFTRIHLYPRSVI